MSPLRQASRCVVLAAAVATVACSSPSSGSGPGSGGGGVGPPAHLQKTPGASGDGQTGVAGTQLASPLSVTVTDAAGEPVSAVTVTWASASGGGGVSAPPSHTSAAGVATTRATLGTAGGTNTYTAGVSGLVGAVTFTATAAKVIAKTSGTSGDGQTGVRGTLLPSPLSVTVTDGASNPVAGITVSWAVASGGGGVSAGTTLTSGSGVATVRATLGSAAGANSYTATVTGLTNSPLTFAATATDAGSASNESWVWPYNQDWAAEVASIDVHATSFTHLSPTFYSLNYVTTYTSGVPYYVTCAPGNPGACTANGANNFGTYRSLTGASASYNGQTITTANFTAWAHSRGFKVVPAIYGGDGNGGRNDSLNAVLCNGGTSGCSAQTALIGALVTELAANGYDGWNFDWETSGAGRPSSADAPAFTAFVNALKAALVTAGRPDALVTVDVIVSNVNGSNCSGTGGWADFGLLSVSSIDRVIIEAYETAYQTAGWTPPSPDFCAPSGSPAILRNEYGSAVLNPASPAYCDFSFTGSAITMCPPNLPADKAVVGIFASTNGTNAIAGQAMAALGTSSITKVAIWPQYDNFAHPFMSELNIAPPGADWYALLAAFLGH